MSVRGVGIFSTYSLPSLSGVQILHHECTNRDIFPRFQQANGKAVILGMISVLISELGSVLIYGY